MQYRDSFPDINRLSIVAAVIMLAFALIRLVSFPAQLISFVVFGILLNFFLDFSTIITGLTALLAATGMDWIIQSHPGKDQYQTRWAYMRHWILPVLTTLVIGVTLNTFAQGSFWWVIYGFGSLLLMIVFVAEYNVVAGDDVLHPLATIGLSGLSFALYLLLAIAVSSANLRLYIRLPLLGVGAVMVISRSLYLRLGNWHPIWAVVNSLVVLEVAVGFHYLPLTATQFGLLLVGIAYALTSIVTAVKESRQDLAFWVEPVMMLALMVIVSIVWR
jgi:hypothetical protein